MTVGINFLFANGMKILFEIAGQTGSGLIQNAGRLSFTTQ